MRHRHGDTRVPEMSRELAELSSLRATLDDATALLGRLAGRFAQREDVQAALHEAERLARGASREIARAERLI